MKIKHTEDINKLRKNAYPPLVDYIDAAYWQIKGDDSKMQAYLSACEAVKLRYPKPLKE